MPRLIGRLLLSIVIGASATAIGCQATPAAQVTQKNQQILALEMANLKLEREVDALRETAENQQAAILALRKVPDDAKDLMVTAAAVELGSYSGGRNLGGSAQGSHDGIRVYLSASDKDGHPIKVPGTVRIELFDLASEQQIRIGSWEFTPEESLDHFTSGPLSYQFTFELPFPNGPPSHEQLMLKASFTDLLTGRVLTDHREIKVKVK